MGSLQIMRWVMGVNSDEVTRASDMSGLGRYGSLHTLDLTYCSTAATASDSAMSELQCGSPTPSTSAVCDGIGDVSGRGQCGALHILYLSECTGISDVRSRARAGAVWLHTLYVSCCTGCLLYTSPSPRDS
eukprot:TRINITY_DN11223_c1_g1_i1.p1 TRINITY_DN11223_c1_g1~~TRINITY_DN11223_c1_g1_i1.p1  ORF type:complete len:131 (+),score=17.12 TRINITY_DN11223_c1_g1_i1:220-612(+)